MTYFRLVGYELRKLFSFTSIKLILVLMFVLNLIFAYSYIQGENKYNVNESLEYIYEMYRTNPEHYWSEYDRIEDDWYYRESFMPVSEYSQGKAFDRTLFLTIEAFIHADEDYHEMLGLTLSQAQAIRDNLSGRPESYSYRYQEQLIRIYQHLNEEVSIQNEPVYGWDHYFTYNAEILFVLLSVAACALVIALNDKTTGFYPIRMVTSSGRKSTAAAKFTAMVIVCMAISLIFAVSILIMIGSVYGLSDVGNAIQAVFQDVNPNQLKKAELMYLVPFPVSIAGFLCLLYAFRMGVAVVFGAVVMMVAVLSSRYLVGGLAGVAFAGIQYWLSDSDIILMGQWKYLSFFSVYAADSFWTRLRSVNIFGYSVDLLAVLIVFLLLILAATFTICLVAGEKKRMPHRMKSPKGFRNREKAERTLSALSHKKKAFRGSFSLLKFEWKKTSTLMLILVLLFAAKCLVSAEYYRWENTSYNRVYRQYMEEIGGEYSAEKADYVQREYDISRALVNRREEMEQAYIAREIDKETFEAYLTEYNTAQAKIPVLRDLMERSAYLEGLLSQKGIRASYVFDEGLERYIYQGTDWLLVLFICIFCCRAVLVEFGKTSSKGPIFQLVQSTSRGRLSLYLKKTLLCLLVSAFVYWLFAAADLFFWLRNWEILSTGDLLVSLPAYSQASAMWTLGGYGVFTLLSGFLGVFLMVFLCLNLALLLKDTIFVYSVQAVVWIVPYFMTSIGLVFCRYFDFTGLVDTKRLFDISYTVMRGGAGELGFFIFFFVIAVLLTAALSSLSVRQIRRGFVG